MEWQSILFTAIGIIVTGLASWIVERIIAFLNTKIKDTKTLKLLTDAINIISNTVKAIYQTYVQNLKHNNAFDLDAQKGALNTAIERVKAQMSNKLKVYVTANFGNLEEWIATQIESVLYDLKNIKKEN